MVIRGRVQNGLVVLEDITGVDVCGPHRLRLAFDNGVRKTVDVFPLLSGPVFEPLRDPIYFSPAALDPICGTVVWPNGAES